jgi:hypothetical protein
MDVEIGTEAPIFLFWEYLLRIIGIFSLQCAHPVGYSSLLQKKMAVWRTFFEFQLAGSGVGARSRLQNNGCLAHFKLKKSAPNGHYNLHVMNNDCV